jgi:CHAT domain-containing protein
MALLLPVCQGTEGAVMVKNDDREDLEKFFNDKDGTGIYAQNFDSCYVLLTDIYYKAEKKQYWDICLKALYRMAEVSEDYCRYGEMHGAVEKAQALLNTYKDELNLYDPKYTNRADMLLMIGSYFYLSGDYGRAKQVLQDLADKLTGLKDSDKRDVFGTYVYIADLYMKMGLYDEVYEYYLLAGKQIPEYGEDHLFYSYIYDMYIGSYFYHIKNFELARFYYIHALNSIKNRKLTNKWEKFNISNYNILALIYQNLHQRDSAIWCMQQSIKLHKPNDPFLFQTYEFFGDCFLNLNEPQNALKYFNKVYNSVNKKSIYRRAILQTKIGNSYQNMGKPDNALEKYQKALSLLCRNEEYNNHFLKNPDLSEIKADRISIRLLISKANALLEKAKLQGNSRELLSGSLATFRLASDVIDKFRQLINTDEFKEFFVTDIRKMYQNAVLCSYLLYQANGNDSVAGVGFYFMEKSKNQVLLDAIKANTALNYGKIPGNFVIEENKYRNQLLMLENRFYQLKFSGADQGLINDCQYENAKVRERYTEFLHEMERSYPAYYNLKFKNTIPDLQELRKILGNRALVEYMVGDSFISIFALNKNNLVFNKINLDDEFTRAFNTVISDLRNALNQENRYTPEYFKSFVQSSGYLYSVLLKTALTKMNIRGSVIIIPDERLSLLPFEVLLEKYPGEPDIVDYKNLDYFIRQYNVHYELSAELLMEHHGRSKFDRMKSYIGFAPSYSGDGLNKVRVLGRKSSGYLTPLKYNVVEIEEAAKVFKGKAFVGSMANAQTFRDNCFSSKIIHIAAHAVINDSIPELSGIFFSNSIETPEKGKIYEDVIYVNEIYNLNLRSDLAILSACETGKGKLLKGEGLISIGRSFQYAGCRGLIISMWKITDLSAAGIIRNFCSELRKGKQVDVSLRNSKIKYLNHADKIHAHPFYWSALVMIGDNHPLYKNIYTLPCILFLIALMFLGIVLYLRRRILSRKI